MHKTSAVEILRKAADLIEERGKQRDQPGGEKSMASTVKAFWQIHGPAILARGHMTETEGWHFMEVLKMVRSAYGVFTPDDYEDKTAYAALAAEAAAAEHLGGLLACQSAAGDSATSPMKWACQGCANWVFGENGTGCQKGATTEAGAKCEQFAPRGDAFCSWHRAPPVPK